VRDQAALLVSETDGQFRAVRGEQQVQEDHDLDDFVFDSQNRQSRAETPYENNPFLQTKDEKGRSPQTREQREMDDELFNNQTSAVNPVPHESEDPDDLLLNNNERND